ncbi:MAG: hypothetical protein H6701_17015 [Myxococcales bacterium]|nr:hypothetical protein [Myxococcales bacterium]
MTLALLAPAASAPATPAAIIEQIHQAFREDDIGRAARLLDTLAARPDVDPADRVWALRNRLLVLDRLDRPCELVAATDEYLAAAADDEQEAIDRRRAQRRKSEAVAECEALARPEELPPPPPPPPAPPPTGRGTLAVGTGALFVDPLRDGVARTQVAAEASLGYVWSGFQLEGALVITAESPTVVTVRPGVRIDLFELVPQGPVQLRVAGQVMIGETAPGVRVGGGVLGGIGALLPIDGGFGLLGAVELSLWPAGLHLAGDGRLGVYYAF